ncbi:MAG: dioxygenase, partial [Betaproteobacteria bacterium]
MQPSALFVSHGSPMTALQGGAAGAFMQSYGQQWRTQFAKPKAILALSAHTLSSDATVLAAREHAAVYDFGGFDPRLRTLRYDAPGSP